MPDEEYEACCFPYQALRYVDQDGVTKELFHAWKTAKGLAPGTKFLVRGRWLGQARAARLAGFEFKINIPTCTVGHNALLVNGVPQACELGLLLVKCWLLENGCTRHGIDALDLEAVRLLSVTPTFLHLFSSQRQARAARLKFQAATEAKNVNTLLGIKGRRKKAFSVGDHEDSTSYLSERDHSLIAYVKDRATKSVAVYPSESARLQIFDAAECYLRIETKLNAVWLRENQLDSVEGWRLYGQELAYQKAYALIRKDLRLDDCLRSRKPKEQDILKLNVVDQEVLRWHLDEDGGHQARNHAFIQAKTPKLAQQQYFSALKDRILKKLRVDISIPWNKQAEAAATGLANVLHYPGLYEPPPELQHQVFSPASALQMIHKLKVWLDAGLPRTIGRTHIPPSLREPPVLQLGHIEVSRPARALLDLHRVPLYQFLRCHQSGVFGEVTLDEVLSLTAAAANFEPVQSRYAVGAEQITVTTEYIAQQGRERSPPVTSVRLAGET